MHAATLKFFSSGQPAGNAITKQRLITRETALYAANKSILKIKIT